MSDVQQIVVDPYLLCLPDPCHSADSLDKFVENILAWSECLGRSCFDVLVSDSCKAALMDDNQYPYQHRLRSLLKQFDVEHVDHETVATVVRSLIERTPSLEDAYGLRTVLYDEHDVRPQWLLTRLTVATRGAFSETLVMLAVYWSWMKPDGANAFIASVMESRNVEDTQIAVSCTVHDLEGDQVSPELTARLPVRIQGEFEFLGSYADFLSGADSAELWNKGTSVPGAMAAIQKTIEHLLKVGAATESQVGKFSLGSKFLESARLWGFGSRQDYAMVLIESCARIVVGLPKNELAPFRVDANANSAQRQREDGAHAFRTHLTKKGPGFRLMYWVTPTGTIEFANVGDKDELVIY